MKTISFALASTLLVGAMTADTLRADEVRLRDGRVLYGKVTKGADTWQVDTREGSVCIAVSEITDWHDDALLRARLRELAKSAGETPFAHLQLAVQAHTYCLEPELWQQLDLAVGEGPFESPVLQKRAGDFLAQLEPEFLPRKWRTASTEIRVRELLQRHRANAGAGRRAALLELLTRETNADKDLRTQARRNSDPQRRLLAVEALLRRGTAGNDTFAWRTAILDGDPVVREGAIAISRRNGQTRGAVEYLSPGLIHSSPNIRVRTAEAYERLADPAAVKLLVFAGPNAGKALAGTETSVRANVAFLQQQAYIRDFDVEVAQASFIADPKVGVLQSGTVLDVTVHGVEEQIVHITRAYRTALKGITGADPGADPRMWATWLMRQNQSPAADPGSTPSPSTAPPQPPQTPRKG